MTLAHVQLFEQRSALLQVRRILEDLLKSQKRLDTSRYGCSQCGSRQSPVSAIDEPHHLASTTLCPSLHRRRVLHVLPAKGCNGEHVGFDCRGTAARRLHERRAPLCDVNLHVIWQWTRCAPSRDCLVTTLQDVFKRATNAGKLRYQQDRHAEVSNRLSKLLPTKRCESITAPNPKRCSDGRDRQHSLRNGGSRLHPRGVHLLLRRSQHRINCHA